MQDIERLEAGNDAGDAVGLGEGAEALAADHRGDMGRTEIAVDGQLRVGGKGRHRRGHGLVGAQYRKVGKTEFPRPEDRPGDGRRCRFEADAEKDHLVLRIFPRQGDGVEGRIDDADVGTPSLFRLQAGGRAGHPRQIAEGRDQGVGPPGQGQGVIDVGDGGDADRTAGAGSQPDVVRQQRAEAVLMDGHGVGAADLHEGQGPG